MKSLHIKECFFELPSDFYGSLGSALMLMANRAIQAEAYKEVYDGGCYDLYEYFTGKDRKGKCVIDYEIIDIDEEVNINESMDVN